MLTRIVKMVFEENKVEEFLRLFDANKHLIASFNGCNMLELHRDLKNPRIFFTISKWESEMHLNNYRNSELFGKVWGHTKALFSEKAEAWSISLAFSSLN